MEPEIKFNVDNVFAYNIALYLISDNGLKMVDKKKSAIGKRKF